MRRSGRSMNRKDRDRGAKMRLTERTRKLNPETRRGVPKGVIGYAESKSAGKVVVGVFLAIQYWQCRASVKEIMLLLSGV